MKVTLESTSKIVEINGVPARVWEGKTESGIDVHCFITRVAVHKDDDTSQFERELKENTPPRNADVQAYPLRMII
jgi:hypothetical protein